MPGNDLTSLRDIVPVAADQQATARANITTILNGILNDIEPKVTPAGLDMSSALSFLSGGVYSPITNVGYLHMEDRAATPAVNESIYTTANNLYYRDGSGNDIALTSGGAVAGTPGSIAGAGYGSPVEVRWDNTPAEYLMKAGAGTHDLADVVMDRSRFSDGSAYFATLGASAGMAATLAFSLPGTQPASTSAMTMTSAGVMGHTRDLSIDTLTLSGDMTVGGELKHAAEVLHLGGPSWVGQNANVWASSTRCVNSNGGQSNFCTIPLDAGDQITNVNVYAEQASAGTLTLALHSVDDTGTLSAAIATDTDTGVGAIASLTLSSLTTTLASGNSYVLIVSTSGAGAVTTGNTYITYNRP